MSREENMIYCKISKTMCTSAWWLPFIATPVCQIRHIMDTNMTRALNKGLAAFRWPFTFNSCRQSAHSGDSYSSQIPRMLGLHVLSVGREEKGRHLSLGKTKALGICIVCRGTVWRPSYTSNCWSHGFGRHLYNAYGGLY